MLDNTGGGAAQFLRIGAGARALGMGEAFCAVAEGPDAIYWNPAGLADLGRPAMSYSHSDVARSVRHEFGAYAHPVKLLRGTVGLSLTYTGQDSLPVLTNANLRVGTFSPHGESISLAYAAKFTIGRTGTMKDYFGESWNVPGTIRPLDQRRDDPWDGTIMLGVNFKLVRESYYTRNAMAMGVDAGVLFRPSYARNLTLGASLRNTGENLKFIDRGQALPTEVEVGASYQWKTRGSRFLVSTGAGLPYFGSPEGKLGLEFTKELSRAAAVAFRVGFKTRTIDDIDIITGMTAGVGLSAWKGSLDIAIQPMGELGLNYRIGMGYRF